METILSQVRMPAVATSMMGALYGAAKCWDDSLTLTDLFGNSGHAFILNIERTLCPSGPTAWDWGAIHFPLRQMYSLKRLCASCDMRSAEEARELIWQRTIDSIDQGRPAVLWDLWYPEFYLAYGYDRDSGEYLVQGPCAECHDNRISWSALGQVTGSVWALFPAPRENADPASARNLALRGAVSWHRWPNERDAQWVFGGDAWDVWIAAMREEELAHDSDALSYNHYVYAECREHAADFLDKLGPDYADAATAYREVATALLTLCDRWPFPAPAPSLAARVELSGLLETARDAESRGIEAITIALAKEKSLPV